MEELNEIIESICIDIVSEGFGTTGAVILMWSLFFGGAAMSVSVLMELLARTV